MDDKVWVVKLIGESGAWLAVDRSGLDAVVDEISEALRCECEDVYTVRIEQMDRATFEALPEFDGF